MQDAPLPDSGSEGDYRNVKTEKVDVSGREAEAHELNCTICGAKKASALLDLRTNQAMHRRLSREWKMQADVIRSTLKAICVECVCKLNMHSEVTRSLMQRMQRLQRSNTVTTTTVTPTQLSPPIADAEVSTTLIDGQEEGERPNRHSCRSSMSSHNGLEAYSAQPPESPSATESGGRHAGAQSGWRWRTRLECQHCGRAYFRRDYFAQHIRRCRSSRDQTRTSWPKCRVLNEASIDGEEQSPVRIYHCRSCVEDFSSKSNLRQHERSKHLTRYSCDLCDAKCDTKYEYEMHHTICSAKREALQRDEASQPTSTEQRVRSTRSRSRACSNVREVNETVDKMEEDDSDEDEDDDQEEAMYTRRMNFTGDWIVNHSRSNSNSALNVSALYDDYEPGETHITTDKEYDLYQLDLLKAQVRLNAFSCFSPACCYQTNNLVALMKHDYMQHWKMSWFYCNKCGDVFTSKVFLDYHMHRQNRGLFICHKCRDEFEFQHQLDRHLLLHSKGINYHCNFCRLEFLSEAKLLAHCKRSGHNPNDEPLIRIDRSLSISNIPQPEAPRSTRQEYQEREFYIPRVKVPSLRPMPLPNHKPFRFSIGIVEFDEGNPPNCVGCH
ncbi:hypothetical protein KR074_003599 [Drosophila pseudoananassae]|nr:hypothetical protein KR074_003599 [Drosophila pseudoananassae]